ncbi:peptidase inhibitor family I36 protein [Streptomyces sp. NPDC093252]|uniref:peptidase inhibitor family I36 protein n=1 Tax=Streptomyces sp. NPDC093252 TaxID=3154980 RepID=UPI00341DD71D
MTSISRLKRRTSLFAGALALTLASTGGVLATATPAAAATCMGQTSLCFSQHNNYGGWTLPYWVGSGTYITSLPNGYHDQVSSLVNESPYSFCFYEHPNMGGLQFRIGPNESWATIPSWMNDKISSFRAC